jgi:hypothetical protein
MTGDGRKKRKREPNKPKRQPTAYTMFVQENYDIIKRANDPNMPGKDVIALIARQWAGTSEEEKQVRLCKEGGKCLRLVVTDD